MMLTVEFSSEKAMKPTSESTALEGSDGFVEYVGSGKLKGKKVLITGGEYDSSCPQLNYSEANDSIQLRYRQSSGYHICS